MSFMLKEIHEQPQILKKIIEKNTHISQQIAIEIKRRNIDFVILAARGTSDHGAIYGKYLFEVNNQIPVALADPSIYTLYNATLKLNNTLVIGVSQSGEAADVAEYLENSKKSGALTVAITNVSGSRLTSIADYTILCNAGEELAVAATKTYTSTQAAFYMLSVSMAGNDKGIERLYNCSEQMKKVFMLEDYLAARAERYRYMESGVVLGRGFNYCTALESALKLAETSYLKMRGYSAADFLHGPIAATHEGDPCFLIAPEGKAYPFMVEMAEKLKSKEAETIIISSNSQILELATIAVPMEVEVEEQLSPLVYIIATQLFSYYLSTIKGNNPDKPRGLNKVTITR